MPGENLRPEVSADREGRFAPVIESLHGGKLLEERELRRSGDLMVVDKVYEGNLGLGRVQTGSDGTQRTIIREMRVADDRKPSGATHMFTIPHDYQVSLRLQNFDGRVSELEGDGVDFLYLPEMSTASGIFSRMAGEADDDISFLTRWGRVDYGGEFRAHANRSRSLYMADGEVWRPGSGNTSTTLKETGITAYYLREEMDN